MACRGGVCRPTPKPKPKGTNMARPTPQPAPAGARKPFASVAKPGTDPATAKPIFGAAKKWNNFLRFIGFDKPLIGDDGLPIQENIIELIETSPPEVSEAMNKFIEEAVPEISRIVREFPQLSFDEIKNIDLSSYGLPKPEDLSRMIPDLAVADFKPIAQEAERRFQQETVPGIMNQLTGLGQSGRSSAFQGALGRAGSDLQSKLAALESAHNLQRGQLQLGQGELGGNLYKAASQRAALMGGLQNDANRLKLGQAETLGRLQLGQQSNQLQQQGNVLSALMGQMNRPTAGYQPYQPQSWFSSPFIKDVAMPIGKAALAAAMF